MTTRTRTIEQKAPQCDGTRKSSGVGGIPVTPEERHCMIAEAAYLIAERRGFLGVAALDDWLQAEAEVDARLSGAE